MHSSCHPATGHLVPVIEAALAGFECHQAPTLTSEGTSGTYVLRGAQGEPTAIFKPIDEEPKAPHNPRGKKGVFGSETYRAGVRSGELTVREVAAWILDKDGFSGVPPTALVTVNHEQLPSKKIYADQVSDAKFTGLIEGLVPIKNSKFSDELEMSQASYSTYNSEASRVELAGTKVGSLQQFVANSGPIENFSSDLFATDEVHKLAILDLRICNLDRNTENILVAKTDNGYRLIPIDHGLSIPDSIELCSYELAWLSFDQAEQPFSQKSLDYISQIDVDQDIQRLTASLKFRPECLRNMKISTLLLKKAAAAGLNLAQIGQIICRPDLDDSELSPLEKLIKRADELSAQTEEAVSVKPADIKVSANRSEGADLKRFSGGEKFKLTLGVGEGNSFMPSRARILTEDCTTLNLGDNLQMMGKATKLAKFDTNSIGPSSPRHGKAYSPQIVIEDVDAEPSPSTSPTPNPHLEQSSINCGQIIAKNRSEYEERGGPFDPIFFGHFESLLAACVKEFICETKPSNGTNCKL